MLDKVKHMLQTRDIYSPYIFLHMIVVFFCYIPLCFSVSTKFMKICFVLGCGLVLYNFVYCRAFTKATECKLLLICFFSYCLTTVIMGRDNLLAQIKSLGWLAIQFFVFYSIPFYNNNEKLKIYLKNICKIIMYLTLVASIVGIIMFILIVQIRIYGIMGLSGNSYKVNGFTNNRLWGIYLEPNYGAVYSVLSMICSLILYLFLKKAISLRVLIANLVVQFLFIIFSASRTGILTCLLALFLFGFFLLQLNIKFHFFSKVFFRHFKIYFLIPFLLPSIFIALIFFTTPIVEKIPQYTSTILKQHIYVIGVDPNCMSEESKKILTVDENDMPSLIHKIDLSRPELSQPGEPNVDISNGRIAQWKYGLKTFVQHPFFGIGDRNLNQGISNAYIRLLASAGITFFLPLTIFGILAVIHIIRWLKKQHKYTEEYAIVVLLLICLFCIGFSSLLLDDLFFHNNFTSTVFWIILGLCMAFTRQDLNDHMDK